MSPIQWNNDNTVGNAHIDEQHREWIKIFNELEESIRQDPSTSSEFQLQLLKKILDFTHEHFREEELLMDLHKYPGAARHRRMHKEFGLQLYEKYRMAMAGELVLRSELMAMIRHWFTSHTTSEDKTTFQYINSTPVPK